jgi:hypothetical protein
MIRGTCSVLSNAEALAVIARRQLSKNSSGGDGVAKPPRNKHHC